MLSVTDISQGARGDMGDVVPFRRIARPERNYLLWLASSGVVTRFQSNHVRVAQPGRCRHPFRVDLASPDLVSVLTKSTLFSACAGQAWRSNMP
jgi:hypothetical protein